MEFVERKEDGMGWGNRYAFLSFPFPKSKAIRQLKYAIARIFIIITTICTMICTHTRTKK